MIHRDNMTRGHKGMRKGISLVEMLVAIVLFGILGTIGYTYYKNYYNTAYAGKQVRIYTIVEQATQLSNAYDLYVAKHGSTPTDINAMVNDKILTEIPAMMPTLTLTGWRLDTNMSIETNNTAAQGDTAFVYAMDVTDENLSTASKLDYCNILNNVAYSDWNLSSTDADINTSKTFYALGVSGQGELEYFHCADINDSGADHDFHFVFAK